MPLKLHILHLEDVLKYSQQVQEIFRSQAMTCDLVRVQTRETFFKAIEESQWDVILADYLLAQRIAALSTARKKCPHIPFIFFSEAIDAELAIESLKAGAADFVFKPGLTRLGSSVNQAIEKFKKEYTLLKEQGHREQALEEKSRELEKGMKETQKKMARLQHFHNILVDREIDMKRLKIEIDSLLEQLGQPRKYVIGGKATTNDR